MSTPQVALTTPFGLPEVSRGTETLVHALARWLVDEGQDVAVVCGSSQPGRSTLDAVPYHRVRAPDLRRAHRDLDPELTIVPAMAVELRRARPDVVHSFLYSDALAARLARIPYVVSYGGIVRPDAFDGHRLRRRAFLAGTAGATAVLAPSRAAADHLQRVFGIDARVVPNVVRVDDWPADDGAHEPGRILCAATPDDRRKRVDVLVAAFARLYDRGRRDLRLVLAGRCGAVRRAELLAAAGAAAPAIELTDDLDPAALAVEYGRASISCLPSLNEAFGLVVVESLASGTPVVVADHGALPELVDDEVGRRFAPDDVDGCAAALASLLDAVEADPGIRHRCRGRAARYDVAAVGPVLVDLYREAAA